MKVRKTVLTAVCLALVSSVALPAWAQTGGNITHVNLSKYFNNDGISTKDNLADGNFTQGILYPAESLPEANQVFSVKGLSFKFPPKKEGMLNNLHCRGQVIDLPDKPAGALYFLGSSDARLFARASGKDSTATTVKLHYTDGETEEHKLRLTSWDNRSPMFDNILAVRSKGFHVQNRISARGGFSIFAAGIYPKRSVPIDRIKLGDSESVHIFALTLSTRRTGDAVISVDRLDWGATGHAVAKVDVRALTNVKDFQIQWTYNGVAAPTKKLSLLAGKSHKLSYPYNLELNSGAAMKLEVSRGGKVLYVAKGHVDASTPLTVVMGQRLYMRGAPAPSEGRVDAYLNVDAAELEGLSLLFELTDAEGKNLRRLATMTKISPFQMPYELAIEGRVDRTRYWPKGIYVPVSFAMKDLRYGTYKIRARLMRDRKEIAQAETRLFAKVEAKASPTNVTFDPDGTMVVKGKRVFPVGILTGAINEEIAKDMSQAGFNFVLVGNYLSESWPIDRSVKMLDTCVELGLGVVVDLKRVGGTLEAREVVQTFRDHPAMVGWHLFEEPVYSHFTLDEIDSTWRELKRVDPYHFFDIIDWSYSSLRRHAPWTAIVTPDRYPIGHTPKPPFVEAIREQVEAAYEAAKLRPKAPGGVKPVWICLQAENLAASDINRPPTAVEERAQAYEAIVAGVRGIMFYEYHCAKRDKVWEPIAKVAAELKVLEPVLVDTNPVRRAQTDDPIDTWLKHHDGHEYLIAVNRAEKPIKAKITIPGASKLLQTQVLFEDRKKDDKVKAEGAGFTDEFEALGVHVYKIEADTAKAVHEVYGVYQYSGVRRDKPGFVRQDSPVSVSLAGGEFEPVCIVVDNRHPDADTFDFRIEVRSQLPAKRLRLARLAYMAARSHRGHPAVAVEDVADAIIPLSEFEPVTIAAGECRHLWLTIDGRGLKPGEYPVKITLRPLTSNADRREREAKGVELKVRVWPFTLPEKTPINVFTWDMNAALKNDIWFKNFVEHRFNTFLVRMDILAKGAQVKLKPDGTLATPPDFSGLTERIVRGKPHAKAFMFAIFPHADGGTWPCTDGSAIAYNSPEWRKGFTEWFRAFMDYLEGQGIGIDQWVWYPFDEAFPGGEKWDKALQQAKLVHEINPKVQFFMDAWAHNAAQLELWRGLNVIWCPDYGIYDQPAWKLLKEHQAAQERPMWMYRCHEGTRRLNPHTFYRCRGWLSWIYGLDGMSYWNCMVHAASPWNDLDWVWGDNSTLLKGGPGGSLIDTLRHDAYRDGVEDYLYVRMLGELLSKPGVDAQTVKEGRDLLEAASEEYRTIGDWGYLGELRKKWQLTEEIAARTQAQRKRIAELIIKLQGSGKN